MQKLIITLWLPFALLALFASCKSIPAIPDAVFGESSYLPLEPGAMAYILADVKTARPIVELVPIQGMDAKQYKDMLDRTQTLAAALYGPESGRRFQLTAWGNYPSSRVGFALGMSRDWKKRRSASGLPYWHSAGSGLSVALNKTQAFAVSSANGLEPFAALPGVEQPEGFGEFRHGAIIACWLENPGPAISRVFQQMEIPLQIPADRVFISLFSADASETEPQYQAVIRLETPGPSQARSLAAILNLARSFGITSGSGQQDNSAEPDAAGLLTALLFANSPVLDGKNLNLKTALLTKKDAALLFKIFSLSF